MSEEFLSEGAFADMFSDLYNLKNRKEINKIVAQWKKFIDAGNKKSLASLATITQKNGIVMRPAEMRDIINKLVKSNRLEPQYMWESENSFKEFLEI